MRERASVANRRRTAALITESALDLAEERGVDGFTMDELAERVGVSRRTLFNYVPGKLDAILGAPQSPDPASLAAFRAGGPTGRLADDVKATFTGVLDGTQTPSAQVERVRRLVASDARLHKAMHDKFAHFATVFADALMERDAERFPPFRAQVAATVTLSLFGVALDAFVADPTASLAEHFVAAFDGAAALFD
ncbi:helix-turn-helix domain-containing protein [Streptomyces griseorubiginosus]|uniref:TetR/AcrR family transcriptional regulator n=1 Tax=Streptomyces griseorubiginosus TaxID=67304 RepID=UPI00339EBB06